jgi:predicted nucleic acid-binding protein
MIVVADTTPLNYLVIIGQVEFLPALYQSGAALERLEQTNFRLSPKIRDEFIKRNL